MTTISAKVIADSIGDSAPRLTTLLLRYPRWIHAEGRTHRVMRICEDMEVEVLTPSLMEDPDLSRNASSSRAMPVEKLIKDVLDDPAIPIFWGKNQKGMQAGEECDAAVVRPVPMHYMTRMELDTKSLTREEAWLNARDMAIRSARGVRARPATPSRSSTGCWSRSAHHGALQRDSSGLISSPCGVTRTVEPHMHMLADRNVGRHAGVDAAAAGVGQWHLPFVNATDETASPRSCRAARR